MKLKFALLFALLALVFSAAAQTDKPLRVFLRAGPKTHGPAGNGLHDGPTFLAEWTKLLAARGCKVEGALNFPTAQQLEQTDVLVMFAANAGTIKGEQRAAFEKFLQRGGGLVCIHDAVVGDDPQWFKTLIGGAWENGVAKWLEGPESLYYVDRTHPITQGVANFDFSDEIYYDLHMMPEARVLAAAYTPNTPNTEKAQQRGRPPPGRISVYDIAPQMWVYEKVLPGGQPWRAFVSIPGHQYKSFELPHYRAVLLRGIAWAGKRTNVDEFNTKEDLASLRYPEGGPSRPEKTLAKMVIHPDFKVSLVASEPLINKAMNLDWDPQGRLWVCETPEYPDGRDVNPATDYVQRWQKDDKLTDDGTRYDRPAYDRISILTDTDGDGVMDKKQIFADYAHGVPGGLERVTSFVFHKGGVIASAAPDIWLLRDTNGDGVCDKAEKIYTGLGARDTHSLINNLRWGFDGWIYATHGYSVGHVTSPDGKKDFGNIGSGVIRFKPDGSAMEQYSSKGGNTWGLQIAWDNEIFWTQPTSGDLLMHCVMSEQQLSLAHLPGVTSYNVAHKSTPVFPVIPYDQLPYVQIDLVGRFTAAAGCAIYDGGSWPAPWNYSYFCTEPTVNIVHHEIVQPRGVTYVGERAPGREEIEFIAGRNMWFRPIETRIGPDGALYVIDFCNQAVIHNDTRGTKHGPRNAAIRPDRDHYYGRIWRVDHKDAKKLKVPNLAKASSEDWSPDWVKALENPNQQVRMTASRLLVENGMTTMRKNNREFPVHRVDVVQAILPVLESPSAQARIAALWTIHRLGSFGAPTFMPTLTKTLTDKDPTVRRNAVRIAGETPTLVPVQYVERAMTEGIANQFQSAKLALVADTNASVRLNALLALASTDLDANIATTLVGLYPKLDDNWSKAALLGVASKAPTLFLDAAFAGDPKLNGPLVAQLTGLLVNSGNADEAARFVVALADKPAAVDDLKHSMLATLSANLRGAAPAWTPPLQTALKKLVTSSNPRIAAAVLPLAVRWDTGKSLAAEVKLEAGELTARLGDKSLSEDARAEVARTLLGIHQTSPEILPAVAKLLGAGHSPALQMRVVEALGELTGPDIGTTLTTALPDLSAEAQGAALNQLLKRAPWSLALLDALDSGKISPGLLGPANTHRLRLHPDERVSQRANAIMDKLRGPEAKEKQALIAKFIPEVEKPGNVAKGKELYTANCATCHQLGDLGNFAGPPLTGMGAHGPVELLVHILDPNREVDFSFTAWSIETKDGEIYDGVVTRENANLVALRNAAGEKEIQKADIKARRNTGRSLMPEGFEALGADGLRDILAFICADNVRFRFIDLSGAFTANSREGLYNSGDPGGGSLPLAKFGIVNALGVPFNVVDPTRHPTGKNLIVLKGGPGEAHSKTAFPQKVEAKVGFEAKQLHILGNVAGWGFPAVRENQPALKITVHYAGGATEDLLFKNGEEFADYVREVDVPGSKLAGGVADAGRQVRFASRTLKGKGVVEKLTFESFDNKIVPTTLAVTADLSADPLPPAPRPLGGAPAPVLKKAAKKDGNKKAAPVLVASAAGGAGVPASQGVLTWSAGTKVLLVGGGTSHDFQKFFNEADSATLKAAGCSVNYTEDGDVTARELAPQRGVDVVVLSVNAKEWATPALRKALFDFANAGKGLVLLHPGVWYNYKDWPEYNTVLAGGGARGHDRPLEFEVKVTNNAHPLMKGLPATFKITDELYWFEPEPQGTPVEVLATTHSPSKDKDYPMIWLVKHPKARIAGIALGHDEHAHNLPEYKKLLLNAVNWAAGK